MVFYRKYRPQKIEELDSKEVRDKLYTVLKSSSVSHAFLFTGPKGLGKTSAARIVAKVLNCEKAQSSKLKVKSSERIEPCNKCDQCKSITNGTNLDILEIDGASNRGIDEIRDLREKIRLSPLASRKKIYIIDEVHMLTQEAFNALLKTLEEPPAHVVFILCTTEPHKVPATITSRCVHAQFKKATSEELIRSFERIIKAEKLKSDKDALDLIASLSDGSFRDGAKILEEIALLTGRKKITKELVEKQYQISNIKYQISKMTEFLTKRDTKASLNLVEKLIKQGIDMKYFIEQLIDDLHSILLADLGVEQKTEDRRPASPASTQGVQRGEQKTELSVGEIKNLIELLGGAYGELKYAVLPQLPLELAIVEWGMSVNTPVGGAEVAHENFLVRSAKQHFSSSPTTNPLVRTGENFVGSPRPSINVTQQDIAKYNENDALWIALIDKVKTYNHSIAGVLRGCSLKSYNGKNLVIEANFKFHRDKLNEEKTQGILREACKEVTKKEVEIEVILKVR